jgi:hypothetical protein
LKPDDGGDTVSFDDMDRFNAWDFETYQQVLSKLKVGRQKKWWLKYVHDKKRLSLVILINDQIF